MKKIVFSLLAMLAFLPAFSQSCYWVFLTDKQGTTFDPYTYFDAKAIERYRQCGADLYDVSNYPLNSSYVSQIDAIASEEVGTSRWLNAVAVMATPEQMSRIEQLSFVKGTHLIASEMHPASSSASSAPSDLSDQSDLSAKPTPLTDQLVRMGGRQFDELGINGKGVRIAVFDGGFPKVNTHQAFKHLFDNHQIIKTWNFCNDKEDVYGWNSHGTMTLSCIAGIAPDGRHLGLATGAEFLLARTEVELEPFKEEVWWMQAMEWADKNGAQIISSSLGYGKERYNVQEMNGTSYVAKAANMAARKGMLVCNSAGNEATDNHWRTIITPADADSALCVGGIEANLKNYKHISFSSFGPSATGKLKPNVSAFGHALAASPSSNMAVNYVDGTSFSCPLVAGFAACALQACPGLTAMQLFHEIEKSADLYPYFDYAFGYGVPQAGYFCNKKQKPAARPTFRFVEKADSVELHLLSSIGSKDLSRPLFFNWQNEDGTLDTYIHINIDTMDTASAFSFPKNQLYRRTLNVWYNGYTASFRLTDKQNQTLAVTGFDTKCSFSRPNYIMQGNNDIVQKIIGNDLTLVQTSHKGGWDVSNIYWDFYIMAGNMFRLSSQEQECKFFSPTIHVGVRMLNRLAKAYSIGIGLEYASTRFNFVPDKSNRLDNLFALSNTPDKKYYVFDEGSLELFQRVRFVGGGMLGKGVHWDLGAYVSYGGYHYIREGKLYNHAKSTTSSIANPEYQDNYKVNFGVTTRIAYDAIGLYCRYRLTGLTTNYNADPTSPTAFKLNLPRFEAGVELCF